jgi:RNA polymerase-binding transcription factor DksA
MVRVKSVKRPAVELQTVLHMIQSGKKQNTQNTQLTTSQSVRSDGIEAMDGVEKSSKETDGVDKASKETKSKETKEQEKRDREKLYSDIENMLEWMEHPAMVVCEHCKVMVPAGLICLSLQWPKHSNCTSTLRRGWRR